MKREIPIALVVAIVALHGGYALGTLGDNSNSLSTMKSLTFHQNQK